MRRKSIGQKVKERREELGWTQGYLANATGYSRVYINKLETDKIPTPSLKAIKSICLALNLKVDEL